MTIELTSKNGSRFYVVILPPYFKKNLYKHQIIEYESVLKILKELQINYIDIINKFENDKSRLSYFPFGLPGHYNEKGYLKVGKVVLEKILLAE